MTMDRVGGPAGNRRLERLFEAALAVTTGRRQEFIAASCSAGDTALRCELSQLLSAAGLQTVSVLRGLVTPGGVPDAGSAAFASAALRFDDGPLLAPGGWRRRPAPVAVPERIGDYAILGQLGRGGMGSVYLARRQPPRGSETTVEAAFDRSERFAIKVLDDRDAHGGQRFRAEAEVTAMCRHAHIVGFHEVGEHEGRPYMALEYIDGQTLREQMSRRRLADREIAAMLVPLLGALAHIHALGVVHQDIKPDNVMVSRAGAVKLLDFGVATFHRIPRRGPGQGIIAGTPRYMAPEQLSGKAGPAADLWSVGVMLHELVTGRTRRSGEALTNADLGPFQRVITACLRARPEDRIVSTRDIEALCQHMPIRHDRAS